MAGDGGAGVTFILPANRYPPHNCREVIGKRILGTPKQKGWVNPRHTVVEYSGGDAAGIPICWRDKMATEKICSALKNMLSLVARAAIRGAGNDDEENK